MANRLILKNGAGTPAPEKLEIAELALDTEDGSLYSKLNDGEIHQLNDGGGTGSSVHIGEKPPEPPIAEGQQWLETPSDGDAKMWVYDGAVWLEQPSAGGGGGDPDWSDVSADQYYVYLGYHQAPDRHDLNVAIGSAIATYGPETVAVGHNVNARPQSVGIGYKAGNLSEKGVAIGYQAAHWGEQSVSIGHQAISEGLGAIALGADARANEKEFAISPLIESVNFSNATVQAADYLDAEGNSIVGAGGGGDIDLTSPLVIDAGSETEASFNGKVKDTQEFALKLKYRQTMDYGGGNIYERNPPALIMEDVSESIVEDASDPDLGDAQRKFHDGWFSGTVWADEFYRGDRELIEKGTEYGQIAFWGNTWSASNLKVSNVWNPDTDNYDAGLVATGPIQAPDFLDAEGNSIVGGVPDRIMNAEYGEGVVVDTLYSGNGGFRTNFLRPIDSDGNYAPLDIGSGAGAEPNGRNYFSSGWFSQGVYVNGSPLTTTRVMIDAFTTLQKAIADEDTLEGVKSALTNSLGGLIEKFEAMQLPDTQEVES